MASIRPDELREAALGLPTKERARLASDLIASLDGDEVQEDDWEAAWTAEIARRTREIKEGKVVLEDGDTVLRELEAEFDARSRAKRPAKKSKPRRAR